MNQELIKSYNFKKKFGQNFLKDENILRNIVEKSEVDKDTLVIEIGIGAAYLTYYLSEKAKNVLGYEIDTSLKEIIDKQLETRDNVEIIYEDFLKSMGLSAMPEDQKQEFLNYVQEELEVRIGERISRGLTETQLNEFDMIDDPLEAAKWLEKNRPDYREIVNRTIEEMKAEIRANRNRLVGV